MRQGWKQLVQPLAGWLLRSLWIGPCPKRGEAGQGLRQSGAKLGSCWDTCCQSAQVLTLPHWACPKGTQLETAVSQLGTSIRNTKSISPICHSRTPLHAWRRLLWREGSTHYFHIPRLAVLTFASHFYIGVSCQPHPPPQKKTKNKFIISYFSKNKTNKTQVRMRRKKNQKNKTKQPTMVNSKTDQRVCMKSKHSGGKG